MDSKHLIKRKIVHRRIDELKPHPRQRDLFSDLSPEQRRALLAQMLRERSERRPDRPLSFTQRRFWFLQQSV